MDLFEWTEAVAPPPRNAHGHIDYRARATREWHPRWIELMRAAVGLIEAGLAEVVTDVPGGPLEVAITEAGRRYLNQARALP